MLDRHGLDYELDWTLGGEPFLTPPGSAERGAVARAIAGRDRRRHRALDHRRHLGRPLHRAHLPAGDGVRPDQRQHPQDRRTCRGGRHRAAEEHLPRARWRHLLTVTLHRPDRAQQRPPRAGGRFVWPWHDQRLRRGGVAGAVGARPAAGRRWTAWPSASCRPAEQAAVEALIDAAHRDAQAGRLPDRRSLAAGRALLRRRARRSCRARSSPSCCADGTLDAWLRDATAPRARPVHRQRQPGGAGGAGLAGGRGRRRRPVGRCAGGGAHQRRARTAWPSASRCIECDGLADVPTAATT